MQRLLVILHPSILHLANSTACKMYLLTLSHKVVVDTPVTKNIPSIQFAMHKQKVIASLIIWDILLS